jgi:hypothetical protein
MNCANKEILKISNDLCYEGHTGGLCEQCDLFNNNLNEVYT